MEEDVHGSHAAADPHMCGSEHLAGIVTDPECDLGHLRLSAGEEIWKLMEEESSEFDPIELDWVGIVCAH